MSSLVLTGSTSGTVSVQAPAVAGSNTATLAAATGTHYPFTAGTAVASTSGTSIDFTGIPSWVKRITVMFNGVSLSGTAYMQVQIGDAGGIENTGYTGSIQAVGNTGTGVGTNLSAGFQTENHTYWNATSTRMGAMTITNVSGNIWVATWTMGSTSTVVVANAWGGGVKTLSDVLTQVRVTTTNGTDTFDAGSINILYE